MKKRCFSLLLATVMVISVFTAAISADAEEAAAPADGGGISGIGESELVYDTAGIYCQDSDLAPVSAGRAPILGDADGGGYVDIVDATIVQRHIIKIPVGYDKAQLMNADIDSDKELTVTDATFIQRYDFYMDTPYAIGEVIPGMTVDLPVRHINLPVGGKFTLTAYADSDKHVTWKSSDTNVATVSSSGLNASVRAKKTGKANVTVTLSSGVKAVCTVDVTSTKTSDSLKAQINSLPLYPIKTGYVALDNKVESVFKKIFKSGYTTYDKVKAVYDYEIDNFTYEYIGMTQKQQKDFYDNPDNHELWSYYDSSLAARAYATLMNNKGVCYNYAAVFTVMMRAIGLECFSIDGISTYDVARTKWDVHTWNNIIINGRFLLFDAQVDDNILKNIGYKLYERFGMNESDAKLDYKYKNDDRLVDLSNFNYFD